MFRAAQETSTRISRREKDFEPEYTQERNPVYSGKPMCYKNIFLNLHIHTLGYCLVLLFLLFCFVYIYNNGLLTLVL